MNQGGRPCDSTSFSLLRQLRPRQLPRTGSSVVTSIGPWPPLKSIICTRGRNPAENGACWCSQARQKGIGSGTTKLAALPILWSGTRLRRGRSRSACPTGRTKLRSELISFIWQGHHSRIRARVVVRHSIMFQFASTSISTITKAAALSTHSRAAFTLPIVETQTLHVREQIRRGL